ncbi:hypothetical protein FB107DRAFT_253690, partial [Schizophyllum commune]
MTPPTVCYPILPWVYCGGVLADSALGAAFPYHDHSHLAAPPSILTECTQGSANTSTTSSYQLMIHNMQIVSRKKEGSRRAEGGVKT